MPLQMSICFFSDLLMGSMYAVPRTGQASISGGLSISRLRLGAAAFRDFEIQALAQLSQLSRPVCDRADVVD